MRNLHLHKYLVLPITIKAKGTLQMNTTFSKPCIQKHVSTPMDEAAYGACAACYFVPNEHLKENAFFLMFGSDLYHAISALVKSKD